MALVILDARTLLWSGNESYQFYPRRAHRLDDEQYVSRQRGRYQVERVFTQKARNSEIQNTPVFMFLLKCDINPLNVYPI